MTNDLTAAVAEIKRVSPASSPWEAGDIGVGQSPVDYQIAVILNAVASGALVPAADVQGLVEALDHAMWLLCAFDVHRYIIASDRDGAEKAQRHMELSKKMTAVLTGKDPEVSHMYWDKVMAVHDATQKVTNHLDRYGFVRGVRPDLETVSPKVFSAMWKIARAAIIALENRK